MSYIINDLKSHYSLIAGTHSLPSFDAITRLFDLESIHEEPLFLTRAIRRCMSLKSHDYFTFVESLLAPVNASPLNSQVNQLSTEDRTLLQDCYLVLAEIELRSLELEVVYDEKAEYTALIDFFTLWNEKLVGLKSIIAFLRTKTPRVIRHSSYLG